jgi:hypothetical protein
MFTTECRVGKSILHPGQMALFLNKNKVNDEDVAVYVGMNSIEGDPRISDDNSYQMGIPNTNLIINAAGIDKSIGKGHFMNECWKKENASARIRAAPNGLPYLIVSMIGNHKKNKELETTYGFAFWCKKIQWNKLSEAEKVLAAEAYEITPDMLFD